MGLRGYPSLKIFNYRAGVDVGKGKDFNGDRSYNAIKRYIENKMVEPDCTLDDKSSCSEAELVILEEAVKMSRADRKAKIEKLNADIKKTRKLANLARNNAERKKFQKQLKEAMKAREITEAAGNTQGSLMQLTDKDEFYNHCQTRACIVAFFPTSTGGAAEEREQHLKIMKAAHKKAKSDKKPVEFMWAQAGDHAELEEQLSIGNGFPVVVAISMKKKKMAVHKEKFDVPSISTFLDTMVKGKLTLLPMVPNLKFGKVTPSSGSEDEKIVSKDL